jgi:hypothetical protein
MPLLRRLPALGQSTLIGGSALGVVKRLWTLKQAGSGVELEAFLLYDSSMGEAVIKIGVRASHADEVFAEEAAEKFRQLLVAEGARPCGEEEGDA